MTIKSIIKEDIQYEKSERTELTTSKIIDSAINEFGKNGYLGGTVNNICNTGINKGLLYHNFKGKDDLYLTCLNFSCQKLLNYLKEQDRTENLENYMSARMNFFSNNPNESRIFFEALLSPPLHLSDKVNQIISEFNALNEKMYNTTLDSIILRDGISRDDAISYFHKIKMPSILGWLIVGMIFGPHAIQLMPQSVLEAGWYKTIIMWMQCAFGVMLGSELIWSKLKTSGKPLIITTLTQRDRSQKLCFR